VGLQNLYFSKIELMKMKENESDEEDNVVNNDRSGWGHPMKKAYHKKMSRMWDHFLQFSIDKTKVVCKYCDKSLNLGVGLSTGKMIKHMTNVHNRSHVDHMKKQITEGNNVSF
jgi:hypothetical protein